MAGKIVARNIVTGNWDHGAEYMAQSANVTLDNFPAAMEAQLTAIEDDLKDLDGNALAARASSMPWGTPCTGAEAFVNMVLKCYVAYRMQLFLYLRSLGAEISTMNCWAGMDPPG